MEQVPALHIDGHTLVESVSTVWFSLFMPWRHTGDRSIAVLIFKLGPRRKWVVNYMCWLLYPCLPWEKPLYPLNWRLGGPQGWSGHFGATTLYEFLPARSSVPCFSGHIHLTPMLNLHTSRILWHHPPLLTSIYQFFLLQLVYTVLFFSPSLFWGFTDDKSVRGSDSNTADCPLHDFLL